MRSGVKRRVAVSTVRTDQSNASASVSARPLTRIACALVCRRSGNGARSLARVRGDPRASAVRGALWRTRRASWLSGRRGRGGRCRRMNRRSRADSLSRQGQRRRRCGVTHPARMTYRTGNNAKSQEARRRCTQSLAREARQAVPHPWHGRGLRSTATRAAASRLRIRPSIPSSRRSRADAPQRTVNARIVRGVVDRFAVHR